MGSPGKARRRQAEFDNRAWSRVVSALAEHAAAGLPGLEPQRARLVVGTLDLHAKLENPRDSNSLITITSQEAALALAQADLLPDVHASSTEA
jgi:hypothetical protein